MPTGKPVDPSLKAEIVSKIRNDGMSVAEASTHYQVSSKSIYSWLREGVLDGNRNLILELNRLRKENEQLYRLLGRATAEMQKSKNKQSCLGISRSSNRDEIGICHKVSAW